MRGWALGAALLIAGCAGQGDTSAEPEGQTLSGTVTLVADKNGPADNLHSEYTHGTAGVRDSYPCRGARGYGDLREGTQVTVRDDAGSIVGVGRLDEGFYLAFNPDTKDVVDLQDLRREEGGFDEDGFYAWRGMCVLKWEVDVPDRDFYTVRVADRNELTYTREDLEREDWSVSISLGP